MLRWFKIRELERGLLYRDGVFVRILRPGTHFVFDPLFLVRVERVEVRDTWLVRPDLDVLVESGELGDEALVVDLDDHQRGLVWVNDRFQAVIRPGLYAFWKVFHRVRVEIVDARSVRFEHPDLQVMSARPGAAELLHLVEVEASHRGLLFQDGRFVSTLEPGVHGFWKDFARIAVRPVDMREQVIDVAGQEIMTADKVTLRLNAVATFRVEDPVRAVSAVEDYRQALYREAQLALRAGIGTRELDLLLSDKDRVAAELLEAVRRRAADFGLRVDALGIRDVILPGEMKEILNRVMEARKAAEANLVTRREETAAMRSQANTARLLDSNPTLMRLRELEVLEKVAEKADLQVVLGETGLAERIVKLL